MTAFPALLDSDSLGSSGYLGTKNLAGEQGAM